MSYILEALRKADAQRQRERPSLHAHPAGAADDDGPGWARAPLLWAAAGVVVVAGAVYLLWPATEPSTNAAPGADIAQTAPAATPAPAVPVMAPSQAATPSASAIAAATAIEPPPPPPVVAARPAPAPSASAPAARPAPVPVARASAPAARPAAAASTATAAAGSASTTAAEGAAPPDAPKLAITGGVYSQDPAQRMLIVGGQVFNEGSQVAPGVVLEQVRPHQAVLSFRGQRYSVGY